MNLAALDEITEEALALALDDGVDSFMRVDTWWSRRESNPAVRDTLALHGHSVLLRIVVTHGPPALLLMYPAVPWNPSACTGLWSLFGH